MTGAGDAFTAGIIYGMLARMDIEAIARFATSMSAMSLASMQTVSPDLSLSKVKEIMKEEKYDK